jgi:RNA polymerase sigma factor (TIGR02999 family)
MNDVTRILSRIGSGDPSAAEDLLPLVYDELRKLAAAKLAQEKAGQTLQATDLVHEAYLRLVDADYTQNWTGARHFFAAAAEAMRRILVDKARRRNRRKHGAGRRRITVEFEGLPEASGDHLPEALDEALRTFETVDPVAYELVKLRYFAGLSLKDAGRAMELPPRTADRLWAYAKAWLLRELRRESS